MFNGKGNRGVTEEESRLNMSGKRRSSYLERRARLLSDTSSCSSHGSEPDPDSIAGMRLRGSPMPSPGGPRNSAPGSAGQNHGTDFADEWSSKGVVKSCEYVGSFSVAHLQPSNRAEFVRLQLQSLQNPKKSRPVTLFISLSGVKVFDPENQQVTLMAHALKRISYATCDPDFCQFAFLSRNPKGPVGIQYCHVFITREPNEAEEINAIAGKAFKVAYASLRSKKQFFELIEELNREQEEYFAQITRQQNAATRVDSWIEGDLGGGREFSVGQGRVWAKQVAGRKQHKQPHIIAAIDPSLQVTSPPPNRCRSPMNLSNPSPNQPSTSQAQPGLVDQSSPDVNQRGALVNQDVRLNSAGSGDSAEEFEWITEEDIEKRGVRPSAPSLQAEVTVKQTQRTIALPPAPYYEVKLCNEWTARSIAFPTTGFSIIHEQNDQAASESRGSMALTETNRAYTPGQILLQDSTVPPPFTYKPKEEDDCYGYGNGYSENRLSEYSDRDSFDYDRSYAILEQFINATCDISVDWLDPDLRPSPVSKEPSERPFADVQSDENSDALVTRIEQQDSIWTNNNLQESQSANTQFQDGMNKPQPAPRKSLPLDDVPTCDTQGQRLSYPNNNQGYRLSRLSSQEDRPTHINGQAMNINQNANEEPGRDKPRPAPRKAKGPAPPIPVDIVKSVHGKGPAPPIPVDVNRLVNTDLSSEKNNLKRSASSASASNSTEASGRALAAPKSLDIAGAAAVGQRLLKGQSSVAGQDSYKRSGGRSPGHVGHKVEVEIGKFRCKKVTNNGVAPPLPPRSTSLMENGASQEGGSVHDNPVQYKDVTEAPWFKAGVPREIAVEILQQEERGAFIVRESKSHPGCFALSIKVDGDFNESGIANYLVVRTKNGGYTIKGFGRDFADLPRLVHHYSLHQEQLPCKLNLSRCNPLFRQDEDEGDEEGGGDLDYTSMTDFKPVMAGMK